MPMKNSAHTYLPDLEALGVLGRDIFKSPAVNSNALYCSIRRNRILLLTPGKVGESRQGLLITRVNAFTLDSHSVVLGGPAPQRDSERIVVLEGSDGIFFHFRKRLLAPYELASELIGMVIIE